MLVAGRTPSLPDTGRGTAHPPHSSGRKSQSHTAVSGMKSEVTLFATQRQLGLPLSCMMDNDSDPFGDAALNTNADYTIRHNGGLAAWLTALRQPYRGYKVRSSCTLGGPECKPDGCIDNTQGTGSNTYLEYKLCSSLNAAGVPHNDQALQAAFAGVGHLFGEIDAKYGNRLNDGIHKHKLVKIITDVFGGVHHEGVKFLKDSCARLRGRDREGNDPSNPLDGELSSDRDDDHSPPSQTAHPHYSRSMQSISLAAQTAIAEHAFRVIRRSAEA